MILVKYFKCILKYKVLETVYEKLLIIFKQGILGECIYSIVLYTNKSKYEKER